MNDTHNDPRDGRDEVAELIRLAGKRQAVDEERTNRVREAARAQWRTVVRQRRRRRLWVAGMSAAALLVVAFLALRSPPDGGTMEVAGGPVRVEVVAGSIVERPPDEQARPVGVGDLLGLGTELETESDGRCSIRLASGHSVRLDRSTVVRLSDNELLELDRGAIYIDSDRRASDGLLLAVGTPLGTIEEIGTRFEVRLGPDKVLVRLREGAVIVRGEAGSHEVRAGAELELAADGTVTRQTLAAHDPSWSWSADLAPMLELEGRTAREFLDWVARERGWALAFEDQDVAQAAERTVLAGTAERLTIDEALEAVLPTCRMRHFVRDGTLVVGAM